MIVYRDIYLQDLVPIPEAEFCIIRPDGSKHYYLNGNRHKTDGPAIIWSNGDEEWYIHDKCHREDGPAVIFADGDVQYWYQDIQHPRVKDSEQWKKKVEQFKK